MEGSTFACPWCCYSAVTSFLVFGGWGELVALMKVKMTKSDHNEKQLPILEGGKKKLCVKRDPQTFHIKGL